MFGAEKIADLFDEIHKDNQKWIESGLKDWTAGIYQSEGESTKFYAAAVTAGVADALYTFAGGMGAGLVDTLRLGEGVKEGTAWGVAKDGLRLITVVGGSLRVVRLAAAELKLGGAMTCTVSSSTKAAILSGSRFRMGVLFDDLAKLFGGRANVLSPSFTGTATPMEFRSLLQMFNMRVTMRTVSSLDDIAAVAREAKGPVVFGVRWAAPAGVPGGGHTMVAFRNALGQVRYADQMGRTVKNVSDIGSVAFTYGEAMIVHDAAMVQAFRLGTVGHFLATPLHTIGADEMKRIEEKARADAKRPAPSVSQKQQGTTAKPPLNPPGAGTLQSNQFCYRPNSDYVNPVCTTYNSYIVKAGDSLWALAQRFYGNGKLYQKIWEANKALLGPNPEKPRLLPGQNLLIP